MKRILQNFCVFLLFSPFLSHAQTQDTTHPRFWRVGLIPYQVFARSSAIYFEHSLKQNFSLEFRLGYTYSQPAVEDKYEYSLAIRGYYLYSGENASLSYNGQVGKRMKFSMMVGQRYWTFRNQWLPEADVSTPNPYMYLEQKSSFLFGMGIGFGFGLDLAKRSPYIDAACFLNTYFIQCWTHDNYTDVRGDGGAIAIIPRTEDNLSLQTTVAIGLKIGFKKQIRSK